MKISESNLVIVDTETTGLEYVKGDRVVQIAAVRLRTLEYFETLVNPGRPIPVVTSAVHHLIDEDVANAPSIDAAIPSLRAWLGHDAVLWAHNAAFDSSMLPELRDLRWSCTMRLARHLVTDAPSYSNQVLRYHLKLDRDALAGVGVHEALGDARVTAHILRNLIDRYIASGNRDDIDALLAFESRPVHYTQWPYGKHRDKKIADTEAGYIAWALSPRGMTDMDPDLRKTLGAELGRRKNPRVSA